MCSSVAERVSSILLVQVLVLGALMVPNIVGAQQTLATILGTFVRIIETAIPLVMLLALIFFVIGAIRLIYGGGDDRQREAGKQTMIWGTIALFCMIAIWGIVEIIQRSFFAGA
jgi:hypothetical protein